MPSTTDHAPAPEPGLPAHLHSATAPPVELRARSSFSFLQGASDPEDLAAVAARLGYRAVALADIDGVYGAPRFFKAARAAGLRPLCGADVSLDDGSRLLLLVESRQGYKNLCRLITEGKRGRKKGQCAVPVALLAERAQGLVAIAGAGGDAVARHLERGDPKAALATARDLADRLGKDRLYLEVQRHLDPREERRNLAVAEIAARLKLPVVATGDVRYATPEGRRLYDAMTCIRAHTTLDAAGRLLEMNAERHFWPPAERARLWRDWPEVLENAGALAERLAFTLDDLGYRFPDAPTPAGTTQMEHLSHLTWAGARDRYRPLHARARAQLEKELKLIEKLGLAGYFLVVWDIVRYCREEKILVQGRGSAANSAVCYALGITAVDPVGMDLLFERFLSEERGEWPDIDLDLPSEAQREKVIQYVYRRYGASGAAMTANVITYRGRSAAREVGKAVGLGIETVERLAKLLPQYEYTEERDRDLLACARDAGLDPTDRRVRLFVELATAIQGRPRHLGQHSGGMIVAAGRLDEVVPIEPAAMEGRAVVQWDKEDCADLGILKVDLLGLGMLKVLEEAVPLVREHEGVELDLAHLPPDDPKVYDMLSRADTVGVFQVESRAQMATLPRLKPRRFYDLVVEVAIIRPGPIVGKMVHPYLARRAGREPVTYPHPSLEPILRRTLGVPLFQEQVMRMAMVAAGFTGGQAEELRRAMGFKRSREAMARIEGSLREGMAARGIPPEAAEEIVRLIRSFALYGFPESHAASFALIAYASAYLKAHHPAAFTCALLNAWPMGFYHPATLVKDAQRHGVRVLPVDVHRSRWMCRLERARPLPFGPRRAARGASEPLDRWLSVGKTPAPELPDGPGEGRVAAPDGMEPVGGGSGVAGRASSRPPPAVRLGLRYVKGLREEAGARIEAGAPFRSVADLQARAELRRDEIEALAECGALAPLGLTRRAALWQVAALGRAEAPLAPPHPGAPSPLPEMTPWERTWADFRASGLSVGPHPIAHVRPALAARGVLRAADLARERPGRKVRVGGVVIVRQRPGTAKGVCFLSLEDETGIANAIVAPDVFDAHRAVVTCAPALVVDGVLQRQDGVTSLRARAFEPLVLQAQPSRDFR